MLPEGSARRISSARRRGDIFERRDVASGIPFFLVPTALGRSRPSETDARLRAAVPAPIFAAPNLRHRVSAFAKVRAVRTVASISLSPVRNGGEGWGEEVLRHGEARPFAIVGHPSPRPSPRSCLTGRGRRTRCSLWQFRREFSHRLIVPNDFIGWKSTYHPGGRRGQFGRGKLAALDFPAHQAKPAPLFAEVRVFRVTHGFQVGQQVEDLSLREGVDQAGRHE